jgi:hypothetical protein
MVVILSARREANRFSEHFYKFRQELENFRLWPVVVLGEQDCSRWSSTKAWVKPGLPLHAERLAAHHDKMLSQPVLCPMCDHRTVLGESRPIVPS